MVLLRDSVNLLPLPIEGFHAAGTNYAALAEANAKSAALSLAKIMAAAKAATAAATTKNPAAKAKAIAVMKTESALIKKYASNAQMNASKVTDPSKKAAAAASVAKAKKSAGDAATALLPWAKDIAATPSSLAGAGTAAGTNYAALAEANAKSAALSLAKIMAAAKAATAAATTKDPAAKAKAIAVMKAESALIKKFASNAQMNASKVTDPSKKAAAAASVAKAKKSAGDAATALLPWAKDIAATPSSLAGAGTATTVDPIISQAKLYSAAAVKAAQTAKALLAKTIATKNRSAADDLVASCKKSAAEARGMLNKIRAAATANPAKAAGIKVYDAAAAKSTLEAEGYAKQAATAAAKLQPLDPVEQAKLDSAAAVKAAQTAKALLAKTIAAKDRSAADDLVASCKKSAAEARGMLNKIRAAATANPAKAAGIKVYDAAAAKSTLEAEGYAKQAAAAAAKLAPIITASNAITTPTTGSVAVTTAVTKTQEEIVAELLAGLAKAGQAGGNGPANSGGIGNGSNGNPQTGGVNMGGGGGGGMYPGAFLGGGGVGAVSGGAMLSGQGILYPNGGYVGYPQLGAVTSAYVPPAAGYMADQWPPLQTTSYGLTPPCSQDVYIAPNSAFAGPPLGSSQQFYGQNLPSQAGPQSMTLIPPSPQPRVTSGAPPARPDLDPIPDGPSFIQQS